MALALNFGLPSFNQTAQAADTKTVNLGNGGSASYDGKGNLVVGNEGTVAEGSKQAGSNNTTIGTDSDTLRKVAEGDTNGQPMDTDDHTKLVEGEGQAHDLDEYRSTEAGGSTAVGYKNHNEGDCSTTIGNNAKISNKPVTYYVDADGNKTASPDNAAWYKDASGKPTKVPQVFRDADGNTTATPQYRHTYTEKDPNTKEDVTRTEITSDAAKADQKDGQPVYNYQKTDNTPYLYTVTLYQAASNSIAAGTKVTANGSNAVAVGYGSTADNSAVAIGDMAEAKENGVAIGKETKATAEGSIALGKGSEADRSGGVTGWDPKTGKSSTKTDAAWKSGEGALSIGNGGASRQITNVAAGSEDSDAVNLAQLKNAMTHYYSVKTTAKTDGKGNNNYLNDGATGDNALAAGVSAAASGDRATAVGYNTAASGENAVAVGSGATASGGGVAFGSTGVNASSGGLAVGMYSTNASSYSAAFGLNSTTASDNSVAVGTDGTTARNSSVAVGKSTTATNSSVAVGANGTTAANSSFAAGFTSKAGTNSSSYGTNIAVGSNTTADNGSSAFGINATANNRSLAIGLNGDSSSSASATNQSIAIGNNAQAGNNGPYAVALGNSASANYYQTTAIGNSAQATAPNATALGNSASANYYATALGNSASANYSYATAIGSDAKATDTYATAVGNGAQAQESGATALGYSASATYDYTTAVGDGAGAHGTSATALGKSAAANVEDSVALGSNSTVYRAAGTTGLDPRTGNAYTDTSDKTWNSTYGALSVGKVDSDGTVNGTRQIIGVAAGTNDTDAVNVAQLKQVAQGFSIHDYSVNSTTTAADTNYNNAGATGRNALAAGVSASATGENAVAIGYGAQAEGKGATVIGQYGKATGRYALAFGGQQTDTTAEQANNVASGDNALSFGERTTASGTNSTAFGWQTTAKEKRATAFGERTTASGANATAFGQLATASGQNSVAFGNEAVANNYGSTAFGNRTEALGEYSTAFGNSTVAAGMNTAAFGTDNVAGAVLDENGAYTNIIYQTNPKNGRVVKDKNGNPIELSREKMDARGNLAYTDNNGSTKSVTYTVSGGETHSYVLLQGEDGNTYIRDYRGNIRSAVIGDDGTVTVGDKPLTGVNLKQANAGANGYHILSNTNATVWGENSIASGEASTAFGVGSTAKAKNSLAALGGTTTDAATNAAAIGKDAKANLADSVALGSGAVADRASGAKGYDMLTKGATTNTSTAWVSNANAIAVGNGSTLTRQITGVAAGSQNTDAVNVAQLKAAGFKVTTQNNGDISSSILNGDTLDFEDKDNAIVSTSKDSKTITVAVSKTPTFDSATFYNPTGSNNEKVTIANGQVSAFNGNQKKRAAVGVDNQGNGTLFLVNDDLSQAHLYTQSSKETGNDGITRMYYTSSTNNGGEVNGVHTIAVLDDGINYAGDNVKPNTSDKVVVKHKLNSTMDITGGADTNNLAGGNIGVVATPAVEDNQGNITQKAKLELKLNKDLTGLNTVTAGSAKIGSAPAGTLKLTENGAVTEKTAHAGSYVTGLDNKDWNTTNPSYVSGRAATEDQLAAVSGTINKGLSFTTNTKDATNTTDNYKGYKVVNRKLGDTIAIKAGDADPDMKYVTTNLTSQIAENGDITISMAESPTFNIVTATSVNLSPKDITTKDQAGYTASARLDAHYRDASLNPDKNVTMADGSTGMVRLHYHDGEGTIHDLATMDDGQVYVGDIKTDGSLDTTGFGRKMNEKTTINGGVTDKANLSDNNIGVVSNGTDTLTVKLAKELKDLTSVTTGKTVLNNGGVTITNDVHDPNKTVAVKGDEVTFGGNQVNNMGSGADDKDDKGNPTYNILTNGANIGDVKNIANSTTDAAKLTGDSNITVTYNDATADGKNTVKLNDSITLGNDNDKKVTIDGTAGAITAGDKVSLDGNTGMGSIGGVTIGNQTGVTTTKMDGDKAKTEDGTFVTGLSNKTWNPDSNGIVSGRAATEDQLKTVSDTVNAGWELDVNGTKQKAVTPTSSKVNFVQGQNISISGSGDDVTVATADDVRFTTIHVTGDKDDSGSYIGGITIGKQSGGNSANPGPGYYITGLENKSWNASQIQSGRAATEDQLKQVAEDIKHGTVDGDKYVTGGTATYGDDGKGSAKLTGTNGLEGTIANLHDYYVTKGEVSDDGKTLTMTKNDGSTFNVSLDKVMQSDMRLVKNPARNDGKYTVDNNGDLTLMVQDANGTESSKQTITLSGLASKAEVDKGLNFAANSGTAYNAKLGGKVTIKGSAPKTGHDYSEENLTTEVDANGNITIKMDKDLTANTVMVSGKDGKDGQVGITGKDGADGTVTTIIKTIGKNGADGKNGTPGVNGTDGITRIVYQDGKDGEAGTTTHTVATLDDGLKFGANAPVAGKTVNPVGNKMNSTIKITGDGDKELDKYSGKNLLTSVEQDGDGNTTIHVLMDKNISADSMVVGQAGKNGKDGYIGINGKDGADGITTTIIRTEKGQPGANGKNGKPGVDGTDITRIVYQNGADNKTVATLDDGLKFSGDDNSVITKKLNEKLQFVGGADKDKLTQNNIGINELEDGKLTIQLVNTPDLGDKGNLKAGEAHIGWFDGDTLNMTKDGTNPSGNKAEAGSYATGLSNKDWDTDSPEYVSGRAATEDQLAKVSETINNLNTAANKRTVVTVNDKSNPATAKPKDGDYSDYDSTNGNLMIAAKDENGKTTYNIKLNDQLAIGQKGEKGEQGQPGTPGKDGKFTVETSKGTTVVIGHDGEPGQDGKDGISVKGQDGKDGVTISAVNGKDGSEGHIGLVGPKGPKGADGKDGQNASADIHVKNGQVGVDGTDGHGGKDGMDRVVYEDHNGVTHEVATMGDGLKFAGDDMSKTVDKKLNETLQIRGDGTYDKNNDTVAEDGNIKTSVDNGAVKVSLSDKINLHQDGSLTVGGDKKDGSTTVDDPIIIKHFDDKTLDVITGVDQEGKPTTSKEGKAGDYVTGLDNKDWNVDKPEYVSGRAATEDQLKKVSDAVNSAAATAGKHTVVTVNDKDSQETKAKAGTGTFGNYAGADKGNLLIAAKDDNGQMTYNIKLNDQLAIGQKGEPGVAGKDGKDGKVTVETKGGTTVVIGHDGEPGKDGRDGLFVTGKDGADGKSGVSITGPNGAAGTNGVDGKVGIAGKDGKDAVSIAGKDGVGHIGLTGPKGADGTPGKDGISIDITTDLKSATLDDGKNVKTVIKDKEGKETTIEQAPRIQYQSDGKNYEVATMDDGLKFVGNDGKEVTKKLNSTLSLTGGITDADALQKASGRNLGVRSNKDGDGLEIVMTDTPDFTKVTVGEGDDTTKKITIGKQTVTGKKSDGSTADQSQTGNYITGLDNKAWDKDNIVENRAATEGQLRDIAGSITNQTQGGGFALTSDEKGDDKIVKQDLGKAIQIKGDTTYKADGSLEKTGNIKTSIDNGAIKVELNKDVDLGNGGSVSAGQTKVDKEGVDTNKITIKDSSISISKDGINGGSKQITNVASGGDIDTNAANIGDVKRIAGEMKNDVTNITKNVTEVKNQVNQMGDQVTKVTNDVTQLKQDVKADRKYQGDDAVASKDEKKNVNVKFGSFLRLTGGAKSDALSQEGNIGVIQKQYDDGETGLSVRLAKHLNLEKTTYESGEGDQKSHAEIDGNGLTINHKDASGTENNVIVRGDKVSAGGNKVENVAPGRIAPDSTDAVNGSQLAQRDQAIGKLGGEVSSLDRRVDRVGAGAAALAALHPQDFDPDDKWDFAVGYGNYRGANAAAVGAFYRPNEDTTLSVGGTVGGGENMVNAGISFKFGQGNHVTNSRVAMAKEILALKDYVQKQDEKIEKLEALVGTQGTANAPKRRSILFPDVPENHWAYAYVKKLADRGLLEGYPDGEFKGTRTITRYEFAAIFSRALENGASVDGDMERMSEEFEPEIRELSLNRFRVDRVEGDDNDRHKIERVRVNDRDELVKQKNGEQKKRYRDVYGSVIEKDAPSDAVK